MASVVLVVDMIKGFMEEDNPLYCGAAAKKIIPNVKKLLNRELKKGSQVFYLADTHEAGDDQFAFFTAHCIYGTPECQVIPDLSDFEGEVIPKRRFSGFYETSLDAKLKEIKPDKLIVVGVCTEGAVMQTVVDARNRDYVVEVPRDCVASADAKGHAFALDYMEKSLGAKIV